MNLKFLRSWWISLYFPSLLLILPTQRAQGADIERMGGDVKIGLISEILISEKRVYLPDLSSLSNFDQGFQLWGNEAIPSTRGALWLKFNLENNSDFDTSYVLSTGYGSRIETSLFLKIDDAFEQIPVTGGVRGDGLNHHHFGFVFKLKSHSKGTAYLYLANLPHIKLEPKIYTLGMFHNKMDSEKYFFGIFSGTIIVMMLYNFSLYIFTRKSVYLHYVAVVFFFYFVLLQHLHGVFWQYYLPYASVNRYGTFIMWAAIVLGMYFSSQFFRTLIETKTYSPRLHKIVGQAQYILTALAAPSIFVEFPLTKYLSIIAFLLHLIIFVVSVIILVLRGVRTARLPLVAFSTLLIGAIFYMLEILGVVPSTTLSRQSIYIGAALESVVLSIALAQRINFLQQAKTKVEVQLEIARSLQENLLPNGKLPPSLDILYYYEPADEIGGDWLYYHIDKRQNWAYILVADVTGHGVSASMVTSVLAGTVISALNSREFNELGAKERLHYLADASNKILFRTASHANKFATMSIAGVDLGGGELHFLNAGHNGFFHKSAEKVRNLGKQGSCLGQSLSPNYGYLNIDLKPSDILFFYTDGLTENEGATKCRLTERSLKKIIRDTSGIGAIHETILDRTSQLWGNKRVEDDVTFIILQLKLRKNDSKEQGLTCLPNAG